VMSEKDVAELPDAAHMEKARLVALVDTVVGIHTCPEEAAVAVVRIYPGHADRGRREMLLRLENSIVVYGIWEGMAYSYVLLPSYQECLNWNPVSFPLLEQRI
jgi:hypothetical protein